MILPQIINLYVTIPHVSPIITIRSNIDLVLDYFFERFSPYCYFHNSESNVHIVSIVRENEKIIINNNGTEKMLSEDELILFLSRFPHQLLSANSGFTLFHGAAMKYREKAFLLLGKSMAGKTTLATYLSYKGFQYYTDDLILFDYNQNLVYPYTKPLSLRYDALNLLKERYKIEIPYQKSKVSYYERGLYTPPNCANEKSEVNGVFFLSRENVNNTSFNLLYKADAFNKIAENSYSIVNLMSVVKAAINISKEIPVYDLVYNDFVSVEKELKQILFKRI